jgi:hypothetical protein
MVTPATIAASVALEYVDSYLLQPNKNRFNEIIRGIQSDGMCITFTRKGAEFGYTSEEFVKKKGGDFFGCIQKVDLVSLRILPSGANPTVEVVSEQTRLLRGEIVSLRVQETVSFVMDLTQSPPRIFSITHEYCQNDEEELLDAELQIEHHLCRV